MAANYKMVSYIYRIILSYWYQRRTLDFYYSYRSNPAWNIVFPLHIFQDTPIIRKKFSIWFHRSVIELPQVQLSIKINNNGKQTEFALFEHLKTTNSHLCPIFLPIIAEICFFFSQLWAKFEIFRNPLQRFCPT